MEEPAEEEEFTPAAPEAAEGDEDEGFVAPADEREEDADEEEEEY